MHHSQQLIHEQALAGATEAMIHELQRVELALATNAQEEELKREYAPGATYPPEVRQEVNESLEHLFQEDIAPAVLSTSASTSADRNRKAFYLSVKALLEVHPPTYVIEEILGYQGRKFNEGKAALQNLLEEGKSNGW